MKCIYCKSEIVYKHGSYKGKQKYKCKNCGKYFYSNEIAHKKEHIIHFSVKLNKTEYNKLTRDNYCSKNPEIDNTIKRLIKKYRNRLEECENFIKEHGEEHGEVKECKKQIEMINLFYGKLINMPNDIFQDEEHYNQEYYNKAYEERMINFDLNMEYFKKIDKNKFNQYVETFVKKYAFEEVEDLNILNHVYGIYMLVLDEYKQVYIGISTDIKRRILSHWNRQKDFSRMIFGDVEHSILSIDSFGALDTTRIYYSKRYIDEEEIIRKFKKEYRLNRVAGGINDEEDSNLRNLMLIASRQKRKLK